AFDHARPGYVSAEVPHLRAGPTRRGAARRGGAEEGAGRGEEGVVATAPIPELTDRYTIEREIGRGGMAIVYLAEDRRHHRPVAVKVLHPHLAMSLGPDRFLREIEIAARLQH